MKKRNFLHASFALGAALLMVSGLVWALSACGPAANTNPQQDNARRAAEWLITMHQNEDGGYSSFSTGADQAPSDPSGTVDAIQALAAAGINPAETQAGQANNPVTYLQNNADEVAAFAAGGGGSAGNVLLGITAANQDPRDFVGYNFVISLTNQISPTGQYNAVTPFDQSLALLGLAAAAESAPTESLEWLKAQQADNGSWDDGFGTIDNPDATGMAMMALVAHGEPPDGEVLSRARNFLASAQLPDGGWEYGPGFGSNTNSTALAVQALSAIDEPINVVGGEWDQDGNTPLSALLSFQSESGAFQTDFGEGPFDDFFTTVETIPALMGQPYPIPATNR